MSDHPPPPAADTVAARAYIGLGANLGDPRLAIQQALAALAALPGTRLVATSPLYRSAPVDASGPDFINAVAALDTSLPPEALLDALQAIEADHGRQRPYRNAPRTLDLDLLLHQAAPILDTPRLTLPHPRLHMRAFVLLPLLDLAQQLEWPGLGKLAAWAATCADQRIERLAP